MSVTPAGWRSPAIPLAPRVNIDRPSTAIISGPQDSKYSRERAEIAEPDELPVLDRFARDRARQWGGWERTEWDANPRTGDPLQGLMRFAGTLPDLDRRATIWDVPTSMRNVDAECRLEISQAYLFEDTAAEEPA